MNPVRPRYAYIERLANRLLADAQVTSAPVPVEEIAQSRGCTIVPASLNDVSGILVRSAESVTIGVNSRHSQTRKRFTIAHELGHLLLHRGQEVRYDHSFRYSLRSGVSSTGTDIEEIEANFFAASILMPDNLLKNDPRAEFIDMNDESAVRELAAEFKVSQQAMALRLARLLDRRT